MNLNKILTFKEVQLILGLYSDSLKGVDLSTPLTVKLDYLGWGKSSNLILLFSMNEIKFKTSVFHSNGYFAREKSFCFRDIELLNKEIDISLSRTKKGYLNLMTAKIKG